MPTPPMLRRREPAPPLHTPRPLADPIGSLAVFLLALIALGLFVAAILAVYTYSTPGVEAPFVVAITIAFLVVLALYVLGHAARRLRAGR